MTEFQLAECIEAGKRTVLTAIRRNLPPDLSASADDVAQETYLRYYRRFEFLQPLAADDLRRWLYVTARNECRRAALKANRDWLALVKHNWNTRSDGNFGREQEEPELTGKSAKLPTQVERLPALFRTVALMRMEGMKLNEIACKLDISLGTVKSRLARAKESLARRLRTDGVERDA